MADIGSPQNWLVSPNREVELMWKDVAIQEKKSRIARYRQDIEDLEKGTILNFKSKIIMLEKEVAYLEKERSNLEVIEVENTEGQNG